MNVVVVQAGEQPAILTQSRRFAPQGAALLGETLGRLDFAENAFIVLDWSNSLGLQPEEVAKPVLIVRVSRRVSSVVAPNNLLTVEVRLDVDDLFGDDNITANNLVDIVEQIRNKMASDIKRRMTQ